MALIECKCPKCESLLKVSNEIMGNYKCPYCSNVYPVDELFKDIDKSLLENKETEKLDNDNNEYEIDLSDEESAIYEARGLLLSSANIDEVLENIKCYSDIYEAYPDNEEANIFSHLYDDGIINHEYEYKLYQYIIDNDEFDLYELVHHLAEDAEAFDPRVIISMETVDTISTIFGVEVVRFYLEGFLKSYDDKEEHQEEIDKCVEILKHIMPEYEYVPVKKQVEDSKNMVDEKPVEQKQTIKPIEPKKENKNIEVEETKEVKVNKAVSKKEHKYNGLPFGIISCIFAVLALVTFIIDIDSDASLITAIVFLCISIVFFGIWVIGYMVKNSK